MALLIEGNGGRRSLDEVHGSVPVGHGNPLKRLFAFLGPAYLVSVGYMDPGNWATDLEGGARFGYALIWVLLMSNLMAVPMTSARSVAAMAISARIHRATATGRG